MKSKILIAVVIVLVVAGGLAGVKVLQIRTLIAAGKAYAPPPVAVAAAVAQGAEMAGHALGRRFHLRRGRRDGRA